MSFHSIIPIQIHHFSMIIIAHFHKKSSNFHKIILKKKKKKKKKSLFMFSLVRYVKETATTSNNSTIDKIPKGFKQQALTDFTSVDNSQESNLTHLLKYGTVSQKEWVIQKAADLPQDQLFEPDFISNLLIQYNTTDSKIELALIDFILKLNDDYMNKMTELIIHQVIERFENNYASEYLLVFQKMFNHLTDDQFNLIFNLIDSSLNKMMKEKLAAISLLCVLPPNKFQKKGISEYFEEIIKLSSNSSILLPETITFAFHFSNSLSDDTLLDFFRSVLTDSSISDECALLFLQYSDIILSNRFVNIRFYFIPLISKLATSSSIRVRNCLAEYVGSSPIIVQNCEIPVKNAVLFLARDFQIPVRISIVKNLPNIYKFASQTLKNHVIDVYLFLIEDTKPEVQLEALNSDQIKMLLEYDIQKITVIFKFITKHIKRWRIVAQFLNSFCSISFELLKPYIDECLSISNDAIVLNPNALINPVIQLYSTLVKNHYNIEYILSHLVNFYKKSKSFWLRRNFILISSTILFDVPEEMIYKYLISYVYEIINEEIKTIQYCFMKVAVLKFVEYFNMKSNLGMLQELKEKVLIFEKTDDPYIKELYDPHMGIIMEKIKNITETTKSVLEKGKNSHEKENNMKKLGFKMSSQTKSTVIKGVSKSINHIRTMRKNQIKTMITIPKVAGTNKVIGKTPKK
ncbi:hypothetical protein TRFO_16454 [Tritrichomonas foetus]|uniref:Uncharacterized protein n=1 Tax=Tritrichomonas foetus TaxID=1144522 RepID=A0A1J4KPZ6_9EUKA|nr:hypothetical protein TRFO_16454 [Tritrichomonas foetus]|eukprot:OHT13367.1 hypothetical protein TRFO_16454 [Tritrichomonas foetus]